MSHSVPHKSHPPDHNIRAKNRTYDPNHTRYKKGPHHKTMLKRFNDKINHGDVLASVHETYLDANHTILPKLQM